MYNLLLLKTFLILTTIMAAYTLYLIISAILAGLGTSLDILLYGSIPCLSSGFFGFTLYQFKQGVQIMETQRYDVYDKSGQCIMQNVTMEEYTTFLLDAKIAYSSTVYQACGKHVANTKSTTQKSIAQG